MTTTSDERWAGLGIPKSRQAERQAVTEMVAIVDEAIGLVVEEMGTQGPLTPYDEPSGGNTKELLIAVAADALRGLVYQLWKEHGESSTTAGDD